MPLFDLPIPELRAYRPDLAVPSDLDEFWATTLEETRRHGLAATFEPVDSGLVVIETFDATFAGFGGAPIRAWLHLPRQRSGRLPAVVEYVGCGGGRGLAEQERCSPPPATPISSWTRAAGSVWSVGDTPDPDGGGGRLTPAS